MSDNEQVSCTQRLLLLFNGNDIHIHILLPSYVTSTELKTYSMVYCDSLMSTSKILPFTSHNNNFFILPADSQLKDNSTTKLFYIHCLFEGQQSYFKRKLRGTLLISIHTTYCTIQVLEGLFCQITINHDFSKVIQTMNILNVIHIHQDQNRCCKDDQGNKNLKTFSEQDNNRNPYSIGQGDEAGQPT